MSAGRPTDALDRAAGSAWAPFAPSPSLEGLYIHVPFCESKCRYCAFCSKAVGPDDARMDDYVADRIREIRSLSRNELLGSLKTVYIGGGTPSWLGGSRLGMLLQIIGLSLDVDSLAELSVEANPGSVSLAMIKDLRSLGVTRISLGVQSFSDERLVALGRAHRAYEAAKACERVSEVGLELSIDLICGGLGQGADAWMRDLELAVQTGAQHISIYPLSVEEGTALHGGIARGSAEPPDEDEQADMMLLAHDFLEERGYSHYEIANFAKPGCEARHNSSYWTGASYLGLGPSAASFLPADWRGFSCGLGFLPSDVDDAFAAVRFIGVGQIEHLSAHDVLAEHLMLEMRMLKRGISHAEAKGAMGFLPRLHDALEECMAAGLVRDSGDAYLIADGKFTLANAVFSRIWGCREP